jgi:hypothetical protein
MSLDVTPFARQRLSWAIFPKPMICFTLMSTNAHGHKGTRRNGMTDLPFSYQSSPIRVSVSPRENTFQFSAFCFVPPSFINLHQAVSSKNFPRRGVSPQWMASLEACASLTIVGRTRRPA